MNVRLFEHNMQAYESAVSLLSERGRAAVIHPTGTGKSFIAFRLCQDNPGKRILWLSPSERIFQTQLENLAAVTEGWQPENVTFLTYAKLAQMATAKTPAVIIEEAPRAVSTEQDSPTSTADPAVLQEQREADRGLQLSDIHPDYIILDEFHRCGARAWGEGVRKLLEQYPAVPVLGLTATAVRYLDDQRDMAEELFGNCVASEMTLGEAIVRGIIKPPKYILCAYSYQAKLEQYERRIGSLKRRKAREDAERCLEKLRRRLGDAEGIGKIFEKYLSEKPEGTCSPYSFENSQNPGNSAHVGSAKASGKLKKSKNPGNLGKYLVFCSSYEHLLQMQECFREWLKNIDSDPHFYRYYTLDPETTKQFETFKNDKDEEHLKLLFCIDALNEGVHVEDVSGVILLRPTTSPIVYKQQIGRALTASESGVPLIFDIVNNVEGLYSVGALQEEIRQARECFDAAGRGDPEFLETFEVIDEAADCRRLFEQLEEALSVSWEKMYEEAKKYYDKHRNLNISVSYVTENELPLGRWLETQRRVYRGTVSGSLDMERKEKLNALGMRWDTQINENFERMYLAAKNYRNIHGDINVPSAYIDEEGNPLGEWIRSLRRSFHQQRKMLLTEEQIFLLEDLGMDWKLPRDRAWEENYETLKAFQKKYPGQPISRDWKTPSGKSLYDWQNAQIAAYRKGKLSAEKTRLLQEAGVRLDPSDQWQKAFRCAEEFYQKEGHLNFPKDFIYEGTWMKNWVEDQAGAYHGKSKKRLTDRQRELLETIGIQHHSSVRERRWQENYRALAAYLAKQGKAGGLERDGDCDQLRLSIPADLKSPNGTSLRGFLQTQRAKLKAGELSEDKQALLEKLGIVWETEKPDPFTTGLLHAKAYAAEKGDLLVPRNYICNDGFALGEWIRVLRTRYQAGVLPQDRIEKLEAAGMVWRVSEERFLNALEDCRIYYAVHGDLHVPEDYVGKSGVKLSYWLSDRRRDYRKGRLSQEKAELLKPYLQI